MCKSGTANLSIAESAVYVNNNGSDIHYPSPLKELSIESTRKRRARKPYKFDSMHYLVMAEDYI